MLILLINFRFLIQSQQINIHILIMGSLPLKFDSHFSTLYHYLGEDMPKVVRVLNVLENEFISNMIKEIGALTSRYMLNQT